MPDLNEHDVKSKGMTVKQTWYRADVSYPEPGREIICLTEDRFSVLAPMYYLEKGLVLEVESGRSKRIDEKQQITKTGYYTLDFVNDLYDLLRYRIIVDIGYWSYPVLPDGKELNSYAHIISQSELNIRKCKDIAICLRMMCKRELSESDRKCISRWVEVYGADVEIVDYVIHSFGWWGNIRTIDIENKLKELHEAGIMTVEKATQFDAQKQKSHTERYKKRLSARKSLSKEEERSEGN